MARSGKVDIPLLPHQGELMNFGVVGPPRMDWEVALVAAQGQGKTFILAHKLYQLARMNRGCDGLLVVPTYPLFRLVHREAWPKFLAALGVRVKWTAQDHAWVWPWGDRLWVRTAEKPQRIVGANVAYLGGDEPAQWPDEAFERAVGRVRDPNATLRLSVFTGTPEGVGNKFAKRFAKPDAKQRRATIRGRHWHPAVADYPEKLLDLYGHDQALLDNYAKALFVPLRIGRCFSAFEEAKHAAGPVTYDPALPLILACDFNVDHLRWIVAQVSPHEIHVIDEIAPGPGATTELAAREFVRRWAGAQRQVVVVGDSSGNARRTSGSKTDYLVIRETLAGHFAAVRMSVPASNPPQKDSVDACNYHFAAKGQSARAVSISTKCVELIDDCNSNTWKPGVAEIDKTDPERTHAGDAFRYLVWQTARPRKPAAISGGSVNDAAA